MERSISMRGFDISVAPVFRFQEAPNVYMVITPGRTSDSTILEPLHYGIRSTNISPWEYYIGRQTHSYSSSALIPVASQIGMIYDDDQIRGNSRLAYVNNNPIEGIVDSVRNVMYNGSDEYPDENATVLVADSIFSALEESMRNTFCIRRF